MIVIGTGKEGKGKGGGGVFVLAIDGLSTGVGLFCSHHGTVLDSTVLKWKTLRTLLHRGTALLYCTVLYVTLL